MTLRRPSENPDNWLNKKLEMTVDRPLGSAHPRHPKIIYPLNYGFIAGTWAGDGHEVDAYLLGAARAVETAFGRCIAILKRHDDVEDKLILSAAGQDYSDEEIFEAINFQEQYFNTELIR